MCSQIAVVCGVVFLSISIVSFGLGKDRDNITNGSVSPSARSAFVSIPLLFLGQSLPHIVIAMNIIKSYAPLNSRFNRSIILFYAAIILQTCSTITAIALLVFQKETVHSVLDSVVPSIGSRGGVLLRFMIFVSCKPDRNCKLNTAYTAAAEVLLATAYIFLTHKNPSTKKILIYSPVILIIW